MPDTNITASAVDVANKERLAAFNAWIAAHNAWVAALDAVPADDVCACEEPLTHDAYFVEVGHEAWHTYAGQGSSRYRIIREEADVAARQITTWARYVECRHCDTFYRLDANMEQTWVTD